MLQAEQDAIVIQAQAGNRKAVGLLYDIFYKDLSRFAYRLCENQQLAADAVQEVWVNTMSTLHRLNDPRAFRSWVFRAVKWKVLDELRHQTRYQQELPDTCDETAKEHDEQSSSGIMTLIKHLSEEERHAMYLFYASELKLDEISLVLEVPLGTVKSRLDRARKKLKVLWEKHYES